MSLEGERITLSISLDTLAYVLTNEFNRETFLEFLEHMAEVGADTGFEWEVIERLFDRLLASDPVAARLLLRILTPEEGEEESSEACYTYDGLGHILFWAQGRAGGSSCVVASHVDQDLVQSVVDGLNERGDKA